MNCAFNDPSKKYVLIESSNDLLEHYPLVAERLANLDPNDFRRTGSTLRTKFLEIQRRFSTIFVMFLGLKKKKKEKKTDAALKKFVDYVISSQNCPTRRSLAPSSGPNNYSLILIILLVNECTSRPNTHHHFCDCLLLLVVFSLSLVLLLLVVFSLSLIL